MENAVLVLQICGVVAGVYLVICALSDVFLDMTWWNAWEVLLRFVFPVIMAIAGIGLMLFHNPESKPRPIDMVIHQVELIDRPSAIVFTFYDNVDNKVKMIAFCGLQEGLRRLLSNDILTRGKRIIMHIKRDRIESLEYIERFYILHNRFDHPEEYILDSQVGEYKKQTSAY